jgi:hypothetical protein
MSSTWNSGIGKFPKKDPNFGWLGKKIKNWFDALKCKIKGCTCKCTGRAAAWNDCTKDKK